jgi:hypothetical protein
MNNAAMREIALLALQDLEPLEAAEPVLSQHSGQRLKSVQIKNTANEMLE